MIYKTCQELFLVSSITVHAIKEGSNIIRWLTVFSFYLSGIFLFSIERANIIILSAILVISFVVLYNSNNNFLREFSIIAIAIAIVLKISPIFFLLIFLYNRKYFELSKCIIYVIILFLLPFLFFKNGLLNIIQFMQNIKLNTALYMHSPIQYRFGFFPAIRLFLQPNDAFILSNVISSIYLIIACGIGWLFSNSWKKVMILTCVVILSPVNSGYYTGMYLFGAIILFLNQEAEYSKVNWIYFILILLVLNPLQLQCNKIAISTIVSNYSMLVMYTLLCAEGIILFYRRLIMKAAIPFSSENN